MSGEKKIRCIICGGEKPRTRQKYCEGCALPVKLNQSRDKKREYRLKIKNYDKGDRLDYKKKWRGKRGWNDYMKEYRRIHAEKIKEQNRIASKKYENKASQ